MKAVIMAGGKGTRLRPLTCSVPKPMVPVVNMPMMEHVVNLLRRSGYLDLACTLCYMPEVIQEHFGDGSVHGCTMRYSVEETPLGTAGSVRALGSFLDSTFLVISGDALTDIDLAAAARFHTDKGAVATIVLTRVVTPLEYGVVIVDDDGRITRFLEKPSWGEVFSDTVNTGIYILEPEVMQFVDTSREFDFGKNLFPYLLANKYPMFGYVADGYWCDVGNLEQYHATHQDILRGEAQVTIGGELVDEGIWVGRGAEIERGASIRPPVVIGDDVHIERGASVGDYSVIGPSSVIAEGASVRRSVVWGGGFIGRDAEVYGAILGSRVSVKQGAVVREGAVIGSSCSIGERAQVRPSVKIWPDKAVEGGAQVNTSLVWGAPWSRRLFGRLGVAGLANIEVTPDFAARLGAAYGSILADKADGAVAVGSDVHPSSKMVKTALAAGLSSSGRSVADIGEGSAAVARFAVAAMGAAGGVHARISPSDRNATLIEFLDGRGLNIDKASERRIENAFLTEDFHRAAPERVGTVVPVDGMAGRYLGAILASADTSAIRKRGFAIAAAYDGAYVGALIGPMMEALGCEIHLAAEENPPALVADAADLVVRTQADLGFVMDRNAEKLALVDEQGTAIPADDLLPLICYAALKSRRGDTVAVPVTASDSVELLAMGLRGRVVRTQTNPRSVMEKAIEARVHAGGAGVPQFQPVLDGLFALVILIEHLAREGITLSSAVESIPRSYMTKQVVDCPWQAKGKVMRRLIEETDREEMQLIDGIKVYGDQGWTLILPDSEEPVFHVYSQAQSQEIAEEIAGIYAARISEAIADGRE
ncbi:MAG: sugar phosphate nucleotidyltransferase [Clostridia bacterium]|nr:sugar phosphate nucleotidyltransferase [Clostridia bacterium]